jgi:hypothetical protein
MVTGIPAAKMKLQHSGSTIRGLQIFDRPQNAYPADFLWFVLQWHEKMMKKPLL